MVGQHPGFSKDPGCFESRRALQNQGRSFSVRFGQPWASAQRLICKAHSVPWKPRSEFPPQPCCGSAGASPSPRLLNLNEQLPLSLEHEGAEALELVEA